MKEMMMKKSKSIKVDPKRDETPTKGNEMMQQLSQIVEIKDIDSQTVTRKDTPTQQSEEEDEPKASGFSKTMKADQDIGQLRFKNLLQTQDFVLDTCVSFMTNLLQIYPE